MTIVDGWKYGFSGNDFIVSSPDRIVRPESFYKYYPLNDHSVDAITKMYLYASHPYQLNDPFDCGDAILRFDKTAEKRLLGVSSYDYLESISTEAERLAIVHRYFNHHFFSLMGIVCLATSDSDSYFWSQYSNNDGFCIELDINQLPFKTYGPFPIHYCDISNPIAISEFNLQDAIPIVSFIKTKKWRIEKEWRLICALEDNYEAALELFGLTTEERKHYYSKESKLAFRERKFYYGNPQHIKNVVLGPRFFDPFDRCFDDRKITIMRCGNSRQYQIVSYAESMSIPMKALINGNNYGEYESYVIKVELSSDTIVVNY